MKLFEIDFNKPVSKPQKRYFNPSEWSITNRWMYWVESIIRQINRKHQPPIKVEAWPNKLAVDLEIPIEYFPEKLKNDILDDGGYTKMPWFFVIRIEREMLINYITAYNGQISDDRAEAFLEFIMDNVENGSMGIEK